MDKKLLYFVRSLFSIFFNFLKSPKIGNFKKLVVESFQSDNDSQVCSSNEIVRFKTVLDGTIKYLFVLLFSVAANSVSAQCVNNLVTNGDFSSSPASSGWTFSGARGSYVETNPESTYFSASTGNTDSTAELDRDASLKQTISSGSFVAGASYTISFIYARRPDANTPATVAVDFRVTSGTTILTFTTLTTASLTPQVGSFTFNAPSNSFAVEFYNSMHGNQTLGTIIDNIVLVPTSQVVPFATTDPKGSFKTLTACLNGSVQLDVDNVPASGVTYTWATSSTGAAFSSATNIKKPTGTFSTIGLKQFTVTATAGGCSRTSTTFVNVIAGPALYTVNGGGAFCAGGTGVPVGLNGSASGVNYQLKRDGTNVGSAVAGTGSSITFGLQTIAGIYTVIATNTTTGCTSNMAGSATVTINPVPTVSITGSSTICAGTTTTLSPTSGGTWVSNNTAVATVNPITGVVTGVLAGSTTFTFTNSTAPGCSATTGVVTVSPGLSTVYNSSNTFTVPAGVTSVQVECWGGGGGGGSAGGNNSEAGGGSGGAYVKNTSISVTPNSQYAIVVGGGGTAGNPGGQSFFSSASTILAVGGNNGGGAIGNNSVGSGGVAVTAGNVGGTTNTYGSAGNGGTTTGGRGGSGGNGGAGGIATTGNSPGADGVAPGGGGAGARRSDGTTKSGGVGGAGQVIITIAAPTATAGGSTTICQTETATVSGASATNGSIAWTHNGGGSLNNTTILTPIYTPVAVDAGKTITLTMTVSNGPCITPATAIYTVIVNKLSTNPSSASAGSATICNGDSTTLTLNGGGGGTGATIKWYTGSCGGTLAGTGNGLSVSPTVTTTYYGRYEDGAPCNNNTTCSSVTVTVNQKSGNPTSASAGSGTICNGASTALTLNGGGGGTGAIIKWYTVSCGGTSVGTGNGLLVSPSVTTTYFGRYEDGTPCNYNSNCSSVTVTVNTLMPIPTITIKQPTCTVTTGTITVTSPAAGYSIDGTDYSNTTGVFDNLTADTYYVTTKNSSGCISPAETAIVISSSNRVWNGSIDTDWTKAGNWTPNIVPDPTDCVVIPTTGRQPEIAANTAVEIYSIAVNNGGLLTVNSKAILTVNTGITVDNGGNLVFEDDSSLLQKTESAINTGNITYKRTTAKVSRYDFTFWSTPVTRTPLAYTLADVSPLTLYDKYYSYIPGTGWKISIRGILPMEKGMGYIVRAPQNYDIAKTLAKTYEASFIGTPNNGTIEITPVKDKNILVGNPYPSALDAKKFIKDNQDIRNVQVGSLYFWTHNSPPSASVPGDYKYNYTTSDYAVFNLTGGTSTYGASTDGNKEKPSGYIAAGAAFFIKPDSNNKIAFTNDMRVGTDNEQFYKTAKAKDEGKNRLWLNLTNEGGAFKQVLIGYLDGATNNWDNNYDGATLDGNTFVDFYSINEKDKLTIQGRALPFTDADVIPLGYVSSIVGDFTISIDEADGLFDTQAVYLEDKKTGKTVDLRVANYTFTGEKGTFEDRFVLHYTNKTLGTGDFENIENGLLVSVKDKAIKVTSAKEAIKEVTIFDINGKLLYDKKKVGSTELQISNLQAANQVLLVKVILENGFTTTRKIVFQ